MKNLTQKKNSHSIGTPRFELGIPAHKTGVITNFTMRPQIICNYIFRLKINYDHKINYVHKITSFNTPLNYI